MSHHRNRGLLVAANVVAAVVPVGLVEGAVFAFGGGLVGPCSSPLLRSIPSLPSIAFSRIFMYLAQYWWFRLYGAFSTAHFAAPRLLG